MPGKITCGNPLLVLVAPVRDKLMGIIDMATGCPFAVFDALRCFHLSSLFSFQSREPRGTTRNREPRQEIGRIYFALPTLLQVLLEQVVRLDQPTTLNLNRRTLRGREPQTNVCQGLF